jgi:CBS domain-containing protein
MKVRELMSRHVRQISADTSIADAAAIMADKDVGALPVVEDGVPVGILTDRDIVVRAIGGHFRSRHPVSEVMSPKVLRCAPDDDVDDVLERMAIEQVRRLPVCGSDGTVIGMFSLGDAAQTEEYQEAAALALSRICRPHGHHCQKRHIA